MIKVTSEKLNKLKTHFMESKSQKKLIAKSVLIGISFMYVSIACAQHGAPWNAPKTVVNMKNPFPADASSLERGKNSYQVDCLRCHGKDGKGDGLRAMKLQKKVTNLGSDTIQKQADGELFWKISEARRPMPLTQLTDDQRWDIVNYIRTFKGK